MYPAPLMALRAGGAGAFFGADGGGSCHSVNVGENNRVSASRSCLAHEPAAAPSSHWAVIVVKPVFGDM